MIDVSVRDEEMRKSAVSILALQRHGNRFAEHEAKAPRTRCRVYVNKTSSGRRGAFTSVAELGVAINDYVAHHNIDPKPSIWTKSARDILQKVILTGGDELRPSAAAVAAEA